MRKLPRTVLRPILIVAAGALLVWLVVAIQARIKQESHRQAIAVWERHEKMLLEATSGGTNNQFETAVDFFSQLTGMRVEVNYGYMGRLPTDRTAEDFQCIKEWFDLNKDLLYFESGSVMVIGKSKRPDCETHGAPVV